MCHRIVATNIRIEVFRDYLNCNTKHYRSFTPAKMSLPSSVVNEVNTHVWSRAESKVHLKCIWNNDWVYNWAEAMLLLHRRQKCDSENNYHSGENGNKSDSIQQNIHDSLCLFRSSSVTKSFPFCRGVGDASILTFSSQEKSIKAVMAIDPTGAESTHWSLHCLYFRTLNMRGWDHKAFAASAHDSPVDKMKVEISIGKLFFPIVEAQQNIAQEREKSVEEIFTAERWNQHLHNAQPPAFCLMMDLILFFRNG